MADPYEHLRKVDLFRDLPAADLEIVCEGSSEVTLADGEALFSQGDGGDAAYVITSGAIEIVAVGSSRNTLLAVRKPGEVIGEMALLQDEPRMASALARDATTVLKVPKPAMTHLLETSPTALRGLFDIVLERLQSTQALMKQGERMVQLGTLTAGVAHELNNPAAAVSRAAGQLESALGQYGEALTRAASSLDSTKLTEVRGLADRPLGASSLSALERSDAEQLLGEKLDDSGVADPWTRAADLVDAGIGVADIDALDLTGEGLATALEALSTGRQAAGLVRSVADGAERLSSIVGALKSYSFLDRAPLQDVDVTSGIEDTLLILGEKLAGVTVERDYDSDLALIEANGSELNQVWTNLLDNAADAIGERRRADGEAAAGRIVVSAKNHGEGIVVEIADDGSGIPAHVVEQIFDSFFTTKEPGKGTGLGLDICRQIVVIGHDGDLSVDSEPGRTTFRVELPIQQRHRR
ncbi:MAG: ATP-binding protein [Microthrixaceae bacterium]